MKVAKSVAVSALIVIGFAGLAFCSACLLQASLGGAELCGLVGCVLGMVTASIAS